MCYLGRGVNPAGWAGTPLAAFPTHKYRAPLSSRPRVFHRPSSLTQGLRSRRLLSPRLVTARSDLDPHLQSMLPSCDGRFELQPCRLPIATSPTAIAIFDATGFLIFAGTPFSVHFHLPTLSRLPSSYPGPRGLPTCCRRALLHSSWPPAAGDRRGDDDGVGTVKPWLKMPLSRRDQLNKCLTFQVGILSLRRQRTARG